MAPDCTKNELSNGVEDLLDLLPSLFPLGDVLNGVEYNLLVPLPPFPTLPLLLGVNSSPALPANGGGDKPRSMVESDISGGDKPAFLLPPLPTEIIVGESNSGRSGCLGFIPFRPRGIQGGESNSGCSSWPKINHLLFNFLIFYLIFTSMEKGTLRLYE